MPTSPSPLRIYFLPLPSPCHVIPMVDIAKLFVKRKVECTLILTPLFASRSDSAIYQYNLKLLTFQFPSVSGLPAGCESTDVLQQPFQELICNNPPDAIVSDAYLPWAAMESAKFNIPNYSFSSTGCFTLSVERSLFSYTPQQSTMSDHSDPFLVSGVPDQIYLTKSQLDRGTNLGEKQIELFSCYREAEKCTDGWVVNTCSEMESAYIKHFERESCKPVFAIGPVCLSGTSNQDVTMRGYGKELVAKSEKLLRWLDGRPSFSVVYVCFGSMSSLPKAQLREIGFGLVDSGVPFIWVVGGGNCSDDVADEVADAAGDSGQVVKGWAPQLAILGHFAVGTLVTNCGWGSVMEAMALGRLILTWPIHREQFYNEKFVVDVARMGASMGAQSYMPGMKETEGVVLSREKVAERVQWAHGAGAEEVRKRAWGIGAVARMEFVKGGSSYTSVDSMMEDIRSKKEKRMERQP